MRFSIKVGARDSPLSRAQVEEVHKEILPHVHFETIFVKTRGDLDRKTSLRGLEKTDFFTKELDEMVLKGECRIAIHSAKDLPEPLAPGLKMVALTKGVDPSDVLVFPSGMDLESLPKKAKIGTSSVRRENVMKALLQDAQIVDIRGTIEERLYQLDRGDFDGVVMALAALIRLKIERKWMILPGEVAPLQGRLAVIAQENDRAINHLLLHPYR